MTVLRLELVALGLIVFGCSTFPAPAVAAAAPARTLPADPAAFYVDFDIRGTVNGLRRRKLGILTLRFNPSWAPNGVRRIREVSAQPGVPHVQPRYMFMYILEFSSVSSLMPHRLSCCTQLLNARYYDDTKFFELLDGRSGDGSRLVRGGVQGNPAVGRPWRARPAEHDPALPGLSSRNGTVALDQPQDGDGSIARSTQFVIHLSDNSSDGGGEIATVPMGEVVSGMEVLESMVEQHPTGPISGDNLKKVYEQGDRFLSRYDSDLPFIHSARYSKRKRHVAAAVAGVGSNNEHRKQEL